MTNHGTYGFSKLLGEGAAVGLLTASPHFTSQSQQQVTVAMPLPNNLEKLSET